MASKLPKPSGLRIPQFKSVRPLGTLSENVINNETSVLPLKTVAHEAPPSTTRFLPASRVKRRSKSVTDLRSIMDKPLTTAKNFKVPLKLDLKIPKTEVKQNKNGPVKAVPKITAPAPSRGAGAVKRPLVSKSDDGASKPKVAKKIPDWDYKGRFNQLNEKYKEAQDSIREMKPKVSHFDEMKINYDTIQKETQELREMKEALEVRYQNHDKIIKELSELKDAHEVLGAEHKSLLEKYEIVCNEKNNINISFDELTKTHNTLSEEHKDITNKFKELTKHYELFREQNNDLLETIRREQQENADLKAANLFQKEYILKLEAKNREQHNTIQDLKGNIRVFCRVRPPLTSEQEKLQASINFIDENGLEISKTRESISQITGKAQDCRSEFTFDKVFPPESTQEEVFEDLAQLVQSALDGYDVCVFAYGQTGSGKTHTMQGGEGVYQGMIPRTIHLIFKKIAELEMSGHEYNVQASFLEIYNENIRDLLNLSSNQKLDIYFNEGKGITVTNLTIEPISSAENLEYYMRLAQNNRATAATNFNEHSSRSHAVTKIYLQGTHKESNVKYTGSINLVDLAGSESAKQSVVGERLTETKNINKSLATLGNVICALHNHTKHIPYRDSKLTYLLQSSLGGNSKTLMFVNVAPFEECFAETVNSLRFAAKVKEVKTSSKRNKLIAPPLLVKQKTTLC